ncbi:hypothetical protein FACS189430_03780 [Bacteroidia bacterium]|nr:hypothetical protein FACS189430_03780 [Bacteroidia bacterium]
MRIVMIGAGNLATHLSKALQNSGNDVCQILSRTEKSAMRLAKTLKTVYTTASDRMVRDADLYIAAVSDDAIAEVISELPFTESLVVHTAGSISLDVFADKMRNYGVLYPLQSFSKDYQVNFSEIPIFLEANTAENLTTLRSIAGQLSAKVYELTSEKRLNLHLAAVFGANFVNSLYAVAAQIVQDAGLPFDVLAPLLQQTVDKAVASAHPAQVQTGPAARNNQRVMQKHIELLQTRPEWQQLYRQLSDCIRNQQDAQMKPHVKTTA